MAASLSERCFLHIGQSGELRQRKARKASSDQPWARYLNQAGFVMAFKTIIIADAKGLGTRIMRSFVVKIGDELLIGQGAGCRGACFNVPFSAS
jgi:hypothetical protein